MKEMFTFELESKGGLPCNSKLNLGQSPGLKGLQFQAYVLEFLGINDKIPQVGEKRIHLLTSHTLSEGLSSFQREESQCLCIFQKKCCIWNMKEANKFRLTNKKTTLWNLLKQIKTIVNHIIKHKNTLSNITNTNPFTFIIQNTIP